MHIVEQYALSCGLKIGEPCIERLFFPLPVDKFITFHNSSKFESRNYDYFNDITTSISPILKQAGVSMIQVGIPEDPIIPLALDLRGRTNFKHLAYVLSKSMLHIGIDSFPLHLAGYFKVPFIGLYSNMHKEHSAPYWRDELNSILLESHREGLKPSYAKQEDPKTINMINPDVVAGNILDLLGMEHKLDSIDSFYIGGKFHQTDIEVVPNFLPNAHFSNSKISLRMDLHWSPENLLRWAGVCDIDIILDRALDINCIRLILPKVKHLIIFLGDDSIDLDYIKSLEATGIDFSLQTTDEDLLSAYRVEFFDWRVSLLENFSKKCIDNVDKICDNTLFKTSKVIFSPSELVIS